MKNGVAATLTVGAIIIAANPTAESRSALFVCRVACYSQVLF